MDKAILLVQFPGKAKEKIWVQIPIEEGRLHGTYDECINKANIDFAGSDWMIVRPVREHYNG